MPRVGQRVHEVLALAIERWRAGEPVDEASFVSDARRKAAREVADARRGLFELDPRRHAGFAELYYGEDPGDAVWAERVDELVEQVASALAHPLVARLRDVPDRVVEHEKLVRFHDGDVPIWVALDVLVEDGRGGHVVIDWKTGRHHVDDVVDMQLALYALYVHRRHRIPVDRIVAVHASTRDGTFRQNAMRPQDVREASRLVHSSAADMRERLVAPHEDLADEGAFAKLEEGATECARCVYRRCCERE